MKSSEPVLTIRSTLWSESGSGIILCTDKDETVVKYPVLKENKQLFASKYKLYLPSEKELIEEIEREKAMIVREREAKYGS